MFATQPIPPGTLIIREKPFLGKDFLFEIFKNVGLINDIKYPELNPEKVKKEVSRLKNIKLERHRNIKFDSQIISKKIVKYSFIIEEFLREEKI